MTMLYPICVVMRCVIKGLHCTVLSVQQNKGKVHIMHICIHHYDKSIHVQ